MIYRPYPRHHHRIRSTLLGHRCSPALGSGRRMQAHTQQESAEAQRRAEIEQELSLARDIQQGLLLEAVPRLPGWEISAISLPAHDLGGDLYDFLPLGENIHGLMIGDVSGKGLPAALRMAVARTVFRHEARRDLSPKETLSDVNRGVLTEIPQGMITMLYARLDIRQGLVSLANAGHNYPVFINGSVRELEISGLPLGVDMESEYEEQVASIEPGETFFLYTDGVIEASDHADELFGYERLDQLLQAYTNRRPRAVMAAVLQELRTWQNGQQADDITMVVIRRRLRNIQDEFQVISSDVLGPERTEQLWAQHRHMDSVEQWAEALPGLIREVQNNYGRGLARELNAQLRLTLDDYR